MASDRRRSYSRWLLSLTVCLSIVLLSPNAHSAKTHSAETHSAHSPSPHFFQSLQSTDIPPIDIAPTPLSTTLSAADTSTLTALDPSPLSDQLTQGQTLYESGQLPAANQALQSALQLARANSNRLGEAITLSNLALVEGQQGSWTAANTTIDSSINLLNQLSAERAANAVLAQTLNIKGRLQFAQGQSAEAFTTWQKAADLYTQANDSTGAINAQLRQARALQALGFHQRAISEILYPLYQSIQQNSSDSIAKVTALNTLAETFQVIEGGTFAQTLTADIDAAESLPLPTAEQIAQQSLETAQRLQETAPSTADNAQQIADAQEIVDAIASTNLTLGNLAFADIQATLTQNTALDLNSLFFSHTDPEPFYQKIARSTASPTHLVRARLNQLNFLITLGQAYQKRNQTSQAQTWFRKANALWPDLQANLSSSQHFPPTRDGIYARINLAQRGLALAQSALPNAPTWGDIETILTQGLTTAETLGDQRSTAYLLGMLGTLHQAKGDSQENLLKAIAYTENALQISKSINATDISYRWYEQLGKLAEATQDKRTAINVYTGALSSLKRLRTDLTTINPELLFSFQESVEPIHRQLVSLLLQDRNPSQTAMKAALSAIESLQVEELNHYLRAACLNAQVAPAADVPESDMSAVIYPVVLEDRLATIVRFPAAPETANSLSNNNSSNATSKENTANEETLEFYEATISPAELKALVDSVIVMTNLGDYDVFEASQQLYELLLPAQLREQLQSRQTETLVFVLDSFLRNLSMATLYDGQQYLIEQYAVAIAPGLQLLNPDPPPDKPLSALTFGLTTPVDNFAPLPSIRSEIAAIKKEMPIQSFFDGEFTRKQLKTALAQSSKPIVHLATHGKFNTNVEETFILATDERVYISELSEWIRAGNKSTDPIELLVFSACETGISDEEGRAALGLAGIAVRSGAKSTIASLWQADDSATAVIMEAFYKQLSTGEINKAKALQNAQKYFLTNYATEDHPYYWGGFILVGSWL